MHELISLIRSSSELPSLTYTLAVGMTLQTSQELRDARFVELQQRGEVRDDCHFGTLPDSSTLESAVRRQSNKLHGNAAHPSYFCIGVSMDRGRLVAC